MAVVHYLKGNRVGVTFGGGILIIPTGYGLEWAAAGAIAMRTPEGALVVYRPRKPRRQPITRRIAGPWMDAWAD